MDSHYRHGDIVEIREERGSLTITWQARIVALVIADTPESYYRLRLLGYARTHHAWIANKERHEDVKV